MFLATGRSIMLPWRAPMRKPIAICTTVGIVAALSMGALLVLAACEGPDGPKGPSGLAGEAGAGTPGPVGAAGAIGPQGGAPDGGLTTSCMTPCHGFNGIVEQWKTSTHYFGAIANTEEEAAWTNPNAACGNCHATDGLPTRLAGQFVIASNADAGPTNYALGELNYPKPGGGASEIGYGGHAPLAIIGCTTCHDAFANDPHLTGGNYTKGEFKLRVPTGPNDQAYLEKSPSTTITGTPAGKWGVNNACVYCHKSRKDIGTYITSSTSLTSAGWGPHEGPHSDVFTGLGGYHFSGKAYTNSTHQQTSGCGTCHMPKVAANGNYPDHSFRAQLSTCTAAGCHGAGTINTELSTSRGVFNAALQDLQRVLNNKGFLTRQSTTPPQGSPAAPVLTSTELADKQFTLDRVRNPGATLSADEAGALYDYLLVARGGARGAHNPFYIKQLIFDAYVAVKTGGDAPTPAGIPVRP